jgi:tripartite-type tricarboxylate transporter receptor subunit TctC
MMQSGPAFNQILGYPNIQYDPRKFHWLLSLGKLVSLAAVRHDTPLHSAQDLFDKKSIFGGESGDSVILPNLLNNLLGAKIQVVKGYGGVPNTIFAMQRGEIEGLSTYWDTLKSTQGDLLRDKKIRVLMQISLEKHPDLPHVPLVMDFVKDDETRQIWELILARQAIGRPLVAPPETPTAKVNELKDALTKMAADQQFLAEASKMNIEINITPGEKLAQLVEQAYKTPPGVIEKTIVALKRAEGQ